MSIMQNITTPIRNSQIQDTIEKYRQVSPCKVELSGRTTLQDKGSLRSNFYFFSLCSIDNFMANGKVGEGTTVFTV